MVGKKGRPKRSLTSPKADDRSRYSKNLEIVRVVYESVLKGKPYRDGIDDSGALSDGVKKAQSLGIKLSQDGIEALVESTLKDPESLYSAPPTRLRDNLLKLKAGFSVGKRIAVRTGSRTRFVSSGEGLPEAAGDSKVLSIPAIKISKKPPGN